MIPSVLPRIWAIGLAVALVVVSGAALKDGIEHRSTIRTLEGDKVDLQRLLSAEQRNIGTCHANVETQTVRVGILAGEINALSEATKANTLAADRAAAANRANTKAAQDAAKALKERPLPPASEACSVAVQTLRGAID